jgi:hypothetical protein
MVLRKAASFVLRGQADSPTQAFRQLTGFEDGPEIRRFQHRRWHLGELLVKNNGVRHYLWRAVDHEVKSSKAS